MFGGLSIICENQSINAGMCGEVVGLAGTLCITGDVGRAQCLPMLKRLLAQVWTGQTSMWHRGRCARTWCSCTATRSASYPPRNPLLLTGPAGGDINWIAALLVGASYILMICSMQHLCNAYSTPDVSAVHCASISAVIM